MINFLCQIEILLLNMLQLLKIPGFFLVFRVFGNPVFIVEMLNNKFLMFKEWIKTPLDVLFSKTYVKSLKLKYTVQVV